MRPFTFNKPSFFKTSAFSRRRTSERAHFVESWLNSYERYRYRRLIHAVRLGLAVVFATLVYGTPVTPMMWVGGVLTLLGVAIITLRTAKKAVEPEAQ